MVSGVFSKGGVKEYRYLSELITKNRFLNKLFYILRMSLKRIIFWIS